MPTGGFGHSTNRKKRSKKAIITAEHRDREYRQISNANDERMAVTQYISLVREENADSKERGEGWHKTNEVLLVDHDDRIKFLMA